MRLTRRDAIISLAGAGAVTSGVSIAVSYGSRSIDLSDGTISETDTTTATAVAEVIYPSEVQNIPEFVDTYLRGLDTQRQDEVSDAISGLNRRVRTEYGKPFRAISVGRRETILREMGVDRVASRPDGRLLERIRYHLVNTLLYALFTSPKGGLLVGIENPVGHPGGYETYQQEP